MVGDEARHAHFVASLTHRTTDRLKPPTFLTVAAGPAAQEPSGGGERPGEADGGESLVPRVRARHTRASGKSRARPMRWPAPRGHRNRPAASWTPTAGP